MNFLRKTQKVLVQTAQKRNLHVHFWSDTKGAIHGKFQLFPKKNFVLIFSFFQKHLQNQKKKHIFFQLF